MLAIAGKKLNKAEKLKLSFLFLEAFWFDIWFVKSLGTGNAYVGGGGGGVQGERWCL